MDTTPTGSSAAVVWMWPRGLTTPGYVMGMLRIPQICCTPLGCRGKSRHVPPGMETSGHGFFPHSSSFWSRLRSTALQVEAWVGGILRRYVSLREPHPRLCTFASPRRMPSGHGGWARRQLGVETSGLRGGCT